MSFDEYIDMFKDCQKKNCPYRAFTFDVVNSRNQPEYIFAKQSFFDLVDTVYSKLNQEEIDTKTVILLRGKFNKKLEVTNNIQNMNHFNPMILGDMMTFFVHNGSISTDRMLEIFAESLEKANINYPFHFMTGVYETNDYALGGEKMYKGYMPQILERASKDTPIVISKNTFVELTTEDK